MDLPSKINTKTARIGIIGLGYVGLPLLAAFHCAGFEVIGFDNDPAKIEALHRGENYLKHLGENLIRDIKSAGRFDATADHARLAEADAILICVPTPLGPHREPDLSYVRQSAQTIAEHLRPGQLIVLESTTYPGTTREIVLPILQSRGLRCGSDFFLAFSPEREDPGRKDASTQTIPKLVGGVDEISCKIAADLYSHAIKTVIPVASAEIAEAAKLLENIYRAVNIALVNEMKTVLTAMGIDIWQVIAAASTKPFGFHPFYPGPGLGGHCIPIDPFYLTWKAQEVGLPTRFIELAGEINHNMPQYVVQRTVLALNERSKPVKGASILILGLAYKPDIDDVRESPSFELIEKLTQLGAIVQYNDPHVPATHRMRNYDLKLLSVELTPKSLAACDCVIISTHHTIYDWQMIATHARLIIDTRGVLRNLPGKHDHIIPA